MINRIVPKKASDVISICIIVGAFILKALSVDGIIDSILVAVSAFYFGSRIHSK